MRATFAFALLSLVISSISILGALAQVQCGSEAGGAVCPNGLCCSKYGYCGTTSAYCCDGCQSQCTCAGSPPPPPPITPTPPSPPTPTPPSPSGGDISSIISEALFNEMLPNRATPPCQGSFLTYDSFITAAKYYSAFGNTGDIDTRKREIAAFFGQTSQETTGGWDSAPGGRYAWGYCYLEEQNKAEYCQPSIEWPCAQGKKYYGRGPIQLTWNYNYGQAGRDLRVDLLNNPDLVMSNPVLCFRTALWFWMTPQAPKPSCHAVITGQWTPSPADISGNRLPGYGVITNIINGGIECGPGGQHDKVLYRIGFYKRYCDLFGISPGDNLDCNTQRPFNLGLNGKIASILPGNHVAV